MRQNPLNRVVTVCDKCFKASCWHGIFMCDDAQTAGTVDKTVAQLRELNVENKDWYSVEAIRKQCGQEPEYAFQPSEREGGR